MSRKISLKTTLFYGGAVLLGILIGPFLLNMAGGLRNAITHPDVAQAAEASQVVAVPDSTDAVYVCAPSYIGAFINRIHVRCTVAAPGGIYYFSTPTSDSKNAARVLSIMLTAKSLGKNLQIYYDPAASGASYGCQTNDCRPITAIEMTN